MTTTSAQIARMLARSTDVSLMLRLESLVVFILFIVLYAYFNGNFWQFLLLLLLPDVSFIAYMLNRKAGRVVYNIAHTYTTAILMGALWIVAGIDWMLPLALIWGAHIAMDRVVGYGLKYSTENKDTHLQRL